MPKKICLLKNPVTIVDSYDHSDLKVEISLDEYLTLFKIVLDHDRLLKAVKEHLENMSYLSSNDTDLMKAANMELYDDEGEKSSLTNSPNVLG